MRKIGILDSGAGGLSILREIRRLLPDLGIHYVGDSAWCPYGNKPPEVIQQRVGRIVEYLLGNGAELMVIACNSATIHAVEWLRTIFPVSFVGTEPGVKPACKLTRTGIVGVLATEASIAGERFVRLVHQNAGGVRVITQPCPRFVELVEAGILEGPAVMQAIAEYIDPVLAQGADVLVLGCTHYPFLRGAIQAAIPATVEIVDTGEAVARRVRDLRALRSESASPGEKGRAELILETTGDAEGFARLASLLLPGLAADRTGLAKMA